MSGFGGFGGRFGFSGPGNLDLVGCPSTDFVLLIQTNATATGYTPATSTNQFRFYGVGTYDIDWGDGTVQTGVSGTQTRTYARIGVYQIRVRNWTGASRRHAPLNSTTTDAIKIRQLQQWGTTQWTSCNAMFARCVNMIGTYSDKPNLSEPNLSLVDMFFVCSVFDGSPYAGMNDWDTSTVTDMSRTFNAAIQFNQNIGNWNTSSVTSMNLMFEDAWSFNKPISSWDVGKVTNMTGMFRRAYAFNQPLSWNTSSVTSMAAMFNAANLFNQPLAFNTSSVTSFSQMFINCTAFNQDISSWNTSPSSTASATTMASMFQGASSFNKPLNSWNVSSVTNMSSMFRGAIAFNQPLNSWNTANVTNMSFMFGVNFPQTTTFDQDISGWNTSSVTNMSDMFVNNTSFNKPLNSWNVSSVTDMFEMLAGATSFNQPLNLWDVSSVTNMGSLFEAANVFNQDISSWNVANVTTMSRMFFGANAFNQNLGAWVLNNNVVLTNMLNTTSTATGMNAENYSRTLIGWANERSASGTPINRSLGASNRRYNATVYGGSPYDNAVDARANLVLATGSGGGGWTITGDAAV